MNVHIFYVAADSDPEAVFLHSVSMEKCAQSMLLVAVWLCAVGTLKRWKFFSRVSLVELHDQGQDFLGHLCQSQVPVVPESPGVYSQVTWHLDAN